MSVQNILITIILGIIAVVLVVWFFNDYLDDDRRDRLSAPIVSTL